MYILKSVLPASVPPGDPTPSRPLDLVSDHKSCPASQTMHRPAHCLLRSLARAGEVLLTGETGEEKGPHRDRAAIMAAIMGVVGLRVCAFRFYLSMLLLFSNVSTKIMHLLYKIIKCLFLKGWQQINILPLRPDYNSSMFTMFSSSQPG